jgi:lipopolysaccharide export system protein LptA
MTVLRAFRAFAPRFTTALALTLAASLAATPARAERADRDKPTRIDAASSHTDDLKQIVVFNGDVVLTKGTLRVTGQRLEFRQDPEGYQYAVVTSAPGKNVTFRQRRDPVKPGIEEYVEATADRLEYDGKAETLRLVGGAHIKRLENGVTRDETRAGAILYNLRDSTSSSEGGPKAGGGRTTMIIAPQSTGAQTTPALPLRPSPQLPRQAP